MRFCAVETFLVLSAAALSAVGQSSDSTSLSIRSRVLPSGIPHTATSSVSLPFSTGVPISPSVTSSTSSQTTFTTVGTPGTILPPPPPPTESSSSQSNTLPGSGTLTSPIPSPSSSSASSTSSSSSSSSAPSPTTSSSGAVAHAAAGGVLGLVLVPFLLQVGLL